jgi:uncharacterized protein (TIGR03083 family)
MAQPSPWPTIHAERKALLDDLEPLTDEQWATPSLCGEWSVREVLGHMTATAELTSGKFVGSLVGSGFRFNTMSAKAVATQVEGTPADLLARFKAQLTATTHPPGPIDAMLGEAIVHGEDIRRPLGISHTYPTDAVTRVADFYKASNLLLGGKKRIAGLRLRATDTDWTTGAGPEVAGPVMSLVMALTGRKAALDDLTGEGLAKLKGRLS